MSEIITSAELDAIEGLAKKATPGPWEIIGSGEYISGPGTAVAGQGGARGDRDWYGDSPRPPRTE